MSDWQTCERCGGNGWYLGRLFSTVCDRCAGAGRVLTLEALRAWFLQGRTPAEPSTLEGAK